MEVLFRLEALQDTERRASSRWTSHRKPGSRAPALSAAGRSTLGAQP